MINILAITFLSIATASALFIPPLLEYMREKEAEKKAKLKPIPIRRHHR